MKLLVITQKVDKEAPILGFFHRWLEEFAANVDELTVICLEEGVHDLPEHVTVFSLGKEEEESRFQYVKRFYQYIFRYRNQYDHVFVHMNPLYVLLGGSFWRMAGKKVGLWYTHKSVTMRLRLAEKLVHTIFSASQRSFRMDSQKVNFVGHGIDTQLFKPAEENDGPRALSILTVGRISPVKDYETLLKAVKVLKGGTDLDFKLTIVGGPATKKDEAYLRTLKDGIANWGIEEKVEFVGSVSQEEVVNYYNKADVCVNMSQTGSVDKVVLEAMATETYPLTSNEAFKDVFKDNYEAYMLEAGNAKSLARKLKNVATKQKDNQQLKKLREIIKEEHSVQALIPHILQLMQSINDQ